MNTTVQRFVPLGQGEAPGVPDLGGWRPLPTRLFVAMTPRTTLTNGALSPNGSTTLHLLSLREAVGLVGLMVNIAAVSNSLLIVAKRLRVWEDTMVD